MPYAVDRIGEGLEGEERYAYMDYAAMAPLCEEALAAMEPWLRPGSDGIDPSVGGMNPNSLHSAGRSAFKELEGARRTIARCIGAERPDTVFFTSGATEADNMAVKGIPLALAEDLGKSIEGVPCHIVVSAIEHDAVLEAASQLKRDGFIVDLVRPDRDGFIEVRELDEVLSDIEESGGRTLLVSIQLANSEIGAIQAVEQLCDCAHSHGALFHTDATQALGKVPMEVGAWGVDCASFSSHKVSGPRGIGAAYVRKGIPMRPLMSGGGQEGRLRSGTQDVCSAVGFAAACEAAIGRMDEEDARLMGLRDELYERLSSFDAIQPTVDVERGSIDFLPNIVNVLFDGMDSNTLVARYDALGFAVSGGSACSSGSTGASHVLEAIGITGDEALGEVRISMGRYTTSEEVDAICRATDEVLHWESRRGRAHR